MPWLDREDLIENCFTLSLSLSTQSLSLSFSVCHGQMINAHTFVEN